MTETAKNLSKSTEAKEGGSAPLRRAAAVLDAVAAARDGVSLQQISDAVGLPASTAHRLTQSLLDVEYLAFDPERKKYLIGKRLVRLVHISQDTASLRMKADPIITKLADQFHQTVFLTQLVDEVLDLVTFALPQEPFGSAIFPGTRFPFNATATGKAIFAHQPRELVDRMLEKPLQKLQPSTIVEPDAVRRELAKVRERGYSVIDGEYDPGVLAIGCPVMAAGGHASFALAVVGLRDKMLSHLTVEQYAAELKVHARDLAGLIARD